MIEAMDRNEQVDSLTILFIKLSKVYKPTAELGSGELANPSLAKCFPS